VAAALAVEQNSLPRQLDVTEIQDRLRRQGALLGADRDPASAIADRTDRVPV
jgi:hypothetical protein